MSKAKRAMGGFQLELGSDHDMKSYNISQQGNELKLRAFLFRDGVLYKDGAQITSIDPQDLDEETKKCVGRGASGSVYFVLHKRTREPLALKEIIITTKPRRDEVSAELAVLAEGIHNPHIIRHFGAYWSAESQSIALVMEWMAYSLEDMTKMLGQLDAHVIKNLAVQLVAGLRFLHDEKRVIHRDIKPSNILINSAGEVKYGDFGISKVVKTVQNISNTFVGTQLFMAPERLEEGEYSFVSDVWSLGLTLICCATGKRPWTDDQDTADGEEGGRNPAQLFQMLQRMASGAVPEFPANFPEAAHDFAKRCLERDPAKRATAAELSTHPFVAGVSEEESRQELSGLLAFASKLACRAAESQTV